MTDIQIKELIERIDKHNESQLDARHKLIEKIIELAAQSCGVDNHESIKIKSRKEELVFARNIVMWYVFNHLNYNKTNCGLIVNKDHATALRAIKIIDESQESGGMYLKPYQKAWLKEFNKLIQM